MDEQGRPMLDRTFAAAGIALIVLSAHVLMGCGGGPGQGTFQDGANTSMAVPAAAAPADTSSGASAPPPAPDTAPHSDACTGTEQGCPCDHAGEAVTCKGPVIRNGDYVMCTGWRVCMNGYWGVCMPP